MAVRFSGRSAALASRSRCHPRSRWHDHARPWAVYSTAGWIGTAARGAELRQDWLCNAGNSLANASDSLGSVSGKLELAGVGATLAGAATAQPEVTAAGLAVAGVGGLGSIGAGALQFGAGVLQGAGGGGFSNAFSAVATLGASATVARFVGGPSVSGYRTVSQRATDSLFQNTATVTGGVLDTITSFLEDLAPHAVTCPGN